MEHLNQKRRRRRRHKRDVTNKGSDTDVIQPDKTIKALVHSSMITNELERLRLIQGKDHHLSKTWLKDHEDVPDIHYAAFYGDVKSVKRIVKTEKVPGDHCTTDGPKLLKQERQFRSDTFSNELYVGFFLHTTPLMMASQQGHLEVVKYLVEHAGAAVNKADSVGLTSLSFATSAGQCEVTRYLLVKHAQRNAQENRHGMTPLTLATVNNQSEMVKLLVRRHTNINIKDSYGRRPIHYAAWNYNLDLVTFLLRQEEVEIAINVQDYNGNTPLHLLVSDLDVEQDVTADFISRRERRDVINIIDRVSKYDGHFCVDITRRSNRGTGKWDELYTCVIGMLRLGASLTVHNNMGQTVLHALCVTLTPVIFSQGYLYIDDFMRTQKLLVLLKIFLKSGAEWDVHDFKGNTPLSLSLAQRNWMAVKILSRDFASQPRSDVTVDACSSLAETVAMFGWGHLVKHDVMEGNIDVMATSLLMHRKQCAKDRLIEKILGQWL